MLLYGGNANLYHLRPSEFGGLLDMLQDVADENTLVVPSVGPAYGTMMDQADILRTTKYPTVMVLPTKAVMTEAGLMTGFRRFVEAINRSAVLFFALRFAAHFALSIVSGGDSGFEAQCNNIRMTVKIYLK